ncbi:MAG: hypothetical protein IPJ43_20545 [Saprospiraceae bacterium]|nr:hypothetical protein [Saprospiraceae bacterium]
MDSIGFGDSCIQIISFTLIRFLRLLLCPPDITLQCPADTMIANTGIASAMDNCMFPVTITRRDSIESGACPAEMEIFRIWTFVDHCMNDTTCIQKITIIDTVAPKFIPSL